MGRIAKILSFVRTVRNGAQVSDVKVDRGGGDNRTAEHFSAPGDDSFPLDTDYAHTEPQAGTGRDSVLGYVDPINPPVATKGDKRIIGRDPVTGLTVVELWLKSNGDAILSNANGGMTLFANGRSDIVSPVGSFSVRPNGRILGSNPNGSFSLEAGGDFVVNGAVISATGTITDGAGIVLGTHPHAQGADSAGDTQQDTGAPL